MIRLAFAVLLFLHGIVHVFGFVVPWQLTTTTDFSYTTSAAWGAIELGDGGARLVGLVMLGLAVAYPIAAVGIVRRDAWAIPLTVGVTLVSLIACLLDSPAAILGVAVDVAILLGLAIASVAGQRLGSHPSPAR